MHKSNPTVKILSLATCLAVLTLTGCSQSSSRQASEEVLSAVERAQRLYEKAFVSLESPVYSQPTPDGPVQFAPVGTIGPDVMPTLAQAEAEVTKALSANRADASAADKAVAQMMLGRIYALQAYCHAAQATQALNDLAETRRRADEVLSTAKLQAATLKYYHALGPLGEAQINEMRSEAQTKGQQVQARLGQIDARTAELQQAQEVESKIFEEYSGRARALRVEGRLEPGQAGLAKLEEGLELQAKADAAEIKAAEIEYELELLAAERTIAQAELTAATSRMEAMDAIVAERQPQQQVIQANEAAALVQLQASADTLVDRLKGMAEACKRLGQARSAAMQAYDRAFAQLQEANRAKLSREGTSAEQADVLMAAADLAARCVLADEADEALAAQIEQLWQALQTTPPAEVETIRSCIPDAEALKTDATAKYTQAAELYEAAARMADNKLRWAHYGQVGTAYMRLYELTGDATAYNSAREAFTQALEGRQYSKHLESIAQLQAMLEAGKP